MRYAARSRWRRLNEVVASPEGIQRLSTACTRPSCPRPRSARTGRHAHATVRCSSEAANAFYDADDRTPVRRPAGVSSPASSRPRARDLSIFARGQILQAPGFPAYEAPSLVAWSRRNRSGPSTGSLDNPGQGGRPRGGSCAARTPACNPYLTSPRCCRRGLEGDMRQGYDAPEPMEKNLYTSPPTTGSGRIEAAASAGRGDRDQVRVQSWLLPHARRASSPATSRYKRPEWED